MSSRVSRFPCPNFSPRFIKKPLVISFPNILACLGRECIPQWLVLVVDPKILFLIWRSNFVCSKEKAFRIAIDEICRDSDRLGTGNDVFRDFIPGDIKVHITHPRIAENGCQHRRVLVDRTNDTTHPAVRPDNRDVRMSFEERFHLGEIEWLGAFLGERRVDVIVNQDNEANFTSEIKNSIEGRVG